MTTAMLPQRDRMMSGVLRFDGSTITYLFQPSGSVSLPISEIALIGEFTVESWPDPMLEDYFLVFVRCGSGEWFEVPMGAAGREETLEQLSDALNTPMQIGLANRTDFTSRIMWPPELKGQPLFTFSRVNGEGLRERLKLLLLPEMSHRLSPVALVAVESK